MTRDISPRYIEAELDKLGVFPPEKRRVSVREDNPEPTTTVPWKPAHPGEEPPF